MAKITKIWVNYSFWVIFTQIFIFWHVTLILLEIHAGAPMLAVSSKNMSYGSSCPWWWIFPCCSISAIHNRACSHYVLW